MDNVEDNAFNCGESIKTLDDIFESPGCGTDIEHLYQILDSPECSTDVEDLDDITGLMGYYPPHGKHICELEDAGPLKKNDYFFISRRIGSDSLVSRKLKDGTFESQLFEAILDEIHVNTMAYQDKNDYSLKNHNHDSLYSKVIWIPNSAYQGNSNTELGKIEIVTSCDVAHKVTASVRVPVINPPLPPQPMIGTFKFVSAKAWAKIQSVNGYAKGNLDTTAHANAYIYSGNSVKDTFDGWVFANGIEIENKNHALDLAMSVFGTSSTNKFRVPDFRDFFKANPKEDTSFNSGNNYTKFSATAGLRAHQHSVTGIKVGGTLVLDTDATKIPTNDDWKDRAPSAKEPFTGVHWGTNDSVKMEVSAPATVNPGTLTLPGFNLTTTGSSTINESVQPYPRHVSVPVMVYIGGVTRKYFELIKNS